MGDVVFCVRTVCKIWLVVWIQIQIGTSFRYDISCNYTPSWKTIGLIWTFQISNDCFIIRDVYFLCQSRMQGMIGEVWLQTCIAVSLSIAICVCMYTQLENYRSYMDVFACQMTTLLYWLCGLELHERSEMWPQTCINCSLIQHFVCILHCKPAYSSLFGGALLSFTAKLVYLTITYCTTNQRFAADDASFQESKVDQLH